MLTVTDNEDGPKGAIISSRNAFVISAPFKSTVNLSNVLCRSGDNHIYVESSVGTSINIYSGEFSPLTASSDFTIVDVAAGCPTQLGGYAQNKTRRDKRSAYPSIVYDEINTVLDQLCDFLQYI